MKKLIKSNEPRNMGPSKVLQQSLNPLKERIRHVAEGEVEECGSGNYRTVMREHFK